jgi:signal transduction histidine kinase
MTVSAREWRFRLTLLLFWILPALMGTMGFVLVPSRLNPTLSLPGILAAQLLMWSLWAVHTLALWWVGDALLPWRRGARVLVVVAHLAAGAGIVTAQIFWQAFWAVRFGLAEPRGLESTWVVGLRTSGDYYVVIVCAIIVAQLGARWYAGLQAERAAAARLGEDLAQAQLRALQAQLNPHFLFNALNSVVTLIGRDAGSAQQLVVQLADLLRVTLKAGEQQEVTLAQELEVTRRYLAIEQVRFADRLTVVWPQGALPEVLVPAFALQPLVENALRHGVGQRTGAAQLRVSVDASAADSHVVIAVHDNGPGLRTPAPTRGTGTGLPNLRARLARLYGDAASLTVQDAEAGGVDAVLRLPWRRVDRASDTHTSLVGSSGR